jgi:aromatic-L-amino-acid decarboxylase
MDARKTACALPEPLRKEARQELTLDPTTPAEWDQLRAEAHRILDETLDNLQGLRAQAAWQPMPQAIERAVDEAPAPQGERSLAAVYAEVASRILPYTSANRHPRAWGWVRGQGTPVAMLADMIASAANAHVGSGHTAPLHVERTVIRWLAEALDIYAPRSENQDEEQQPSGLLTSGATMANLLGIAVARHARAPFDVRGEGLAGQAALRVYCSTETHIWATKAMELLGLGRRALCMLAADAEGRVPLNALRAKVEQDRADGAVPLAVIANAGTVNTGAFDDFVGLRTLCDELGLWMHVDGAFGALLKLTQSHRPLVAGMEKADSVAFDLHKWMYLPFATGCLIVRDAAAHREAFQTAPAYMERGAKGMLAGELSFSDLGIESSRSFKALRVWMQLSVHGFVKHGALIEQNMEQAAFLETCIRERAPALEMMALRPANIVCFRYRPDGRTGEPADPERLNTLNRAITHAVQAGGRFVVSGTTLASGAYALRVAITNHRSRREDFSALADAVIMTGRSLAHS